MSINGLNNIRTSVMCLMMMMAMLFAGIPVAGGQTRDIVDLPEVVVEKRKNTMLHVLAYVREYSSLSSYTDTISMFSEKMIDFMLPIEEKSRFKGWHYPRPLATRSYYHYTDANGLDSVSSRCNHYFTWTDWIGMIPSMQIPGPIVKVRNGTDTICGKYCPAEIWMKNGDSVSLDINVLADTVSRKWVPDMSYFFKKENTDFEQFRLRVNYENVLGKEVTPRDITGYSFTIESKGRGRGMFRFNRHDQPFFVSTHAEVYILDKEVISVKEAKKWGSRKFPADEVEILEPAEAPELSPAILSLIGRVNAIDTDGVRLTAKSDGLLSIETPKRKLDIGHRALSMLKQLTGITYYKSHKNFNNKWDKFRESRKKKSK